MRTCVVCGNEFEPARTSGKPQVACSVRCRKRRSKRREVERLRAMTPEERHIWRQPKPQLEKVTAALVPVLAVQSRPIGSLWVWR